MNAYVLDAIIKQNLVDFYMYVSALFLCFGMYLVFTYFKIRYETTVTQKMVHHLRLRLLSSIVKSEYHSFKDKKYTTYVSWLTNDMGQIEQQVISPMYDLIDGVILTIGSIISLFFIHWSLVLLTIIEVVMLMKLRALFEQSVQDVTEQLSETNEQFVDDITDLLSAFDTLFMFKKLAFILTKGQVKSSDLVKVKQHYSRVMSVMVIVSGLGNVISQVSIFALTGYLAFIGTITVGYITTTGSLASSIFNTVGNLGQYLAIINGWSRILNKMQHHLIQSNQPNTAASRVLTTGYQLTNLNYHTDNKTILSNVNFKFELGHKYAIIGASGSGKSTLLDLLIGKYKDYSGSIDFNQDEISSLTMDDILDNVTYLNQQPSILNASIKENLCLGDHLDENEIWNALKIVSLNLDVQSLPLQLDTVIGDNGHTLSGGQLQRLTIARALLRPKKILLLDEITAHLDSHTAKQIEQHILSHEDLTVIMVTHHLSEEIKTQLHDVLTLTS